VIVRVENPEQKLLPGMTANATFLVNQAIDVIKVPSAALRFRPTQGGAGGAARPGAQAAGNPQMRGSGGGAGPAAGPGGDPAGRNRGSAVFVLDPSGGLRRIRVTPGISDGTYTAVASDSLGEGTPVVIGTSTAAGGAAPQGQVNPFMPGGGGMGRGGRR
jgi:HlyD family secretion protein